MTAPATSRRIAAGITPDPGATSRLPAWWGDDDWLEEVAGALDERPELLRDHSVSREAVLATARGMAAHADFSTGRGCRPTNARLVEVLRYSLSVVQRARRVLKALDLVVELVRGRSIMTRTERLEAWRRGSSHRMVAAEFALCSRRRRAPKVGSSDVREGANDLGACVHLVDGDTPPGAKNVSSLSHVRTTHLRRRTETKIGAPRRAHTGKVGGTAAGGHAPAVRRLADAVQRRVRWLSDVSPGRIAPTLARFAREGWTPRDVERAAVDSMAARGWKLPRTLQQPAAYLATLLREVDEADRPGAQDEYRARVEAAQRAYERQLIHGAPCPHGQPAGHVPSPLRGLLACPACRAGGR